MPSLHDVVIIGAGAAGLATARELAAAGCAPLVLERFARGHRRGSSFGRSRIVRLAHDVADDVRDAREALALWRALERSGGRRLLTPVGGLEFGGRIDETCRAMAEAGVPFEVLGPDEIERRFPAVNARGERAVLQADTAVVAADLAVQLLEAQAEAHGARVRYGAAVQGIEATDDHVDVVLADERIRARAVVVCAGGWSSGLVAQVGVDLPATPTLQSPAHFRFACAAPGPVPTVIELTDAGRDMYSLPEDGGAVVKGGVHDPGPPVDLDGDREPDPPSVAEFAAWTATRYRGLEPEPYDAYGCVYTWLPGARFRLERHGRVVVASCCSGRGFKFVPLTGVRAAAMVRRVLDADEHAPQKGTSR